MAMYLKHNTASTGLFLNSGNPGDSEVSLQKPYIGTYDETSNVITPMMIFDTSASLKTNFSG